MGGLSIWHWLIVLLVVVLVFGTSKLKNMGKDLGSAIKGFKEAVKEGEDEVKEPAKLNNKESDIIEHEAANSKEDKNV